MENLSKHSSQFFLIFFISSASILGKKEFFESMISKCPCVKIIGQPFKTVTSADVRACLVYAFSVPGSAAIDCCVRFQYVFFYFLRSLWTARLNLKKMVLGIFRFYNSLAYVRRTHIHTLQDSCRFFQKISIFKDFCRLFKLYKNIAENVILERILYESSKRHLLCENLSMLVFFSKILQNSSRLMHYLASSCKNLRRNEFPLN